MARTSVLFPEDFPPEIINYQPPASVPARNPDAQRSLEDIDKEHILAVLNDVKYNKVEAAKVLGIGRVTLYRKAKKYGIEL